MADIPINEVTRRVQFTGNTTTGPFAFTFNILSDDDIIVYKNFVLQTITTHYTVSTNANGTGSITLTSPLVASDVLTIIGGRALERTTDFVTAGDLLASSLNEQLDSQVIMAQQLDEKLDRALKVDIGDQFTDLSLPSKANRLGAVLAFNATSGDPEAGPTIADVSSLAAITADIATLADIEDGTDATDAIQTVAGISSNVSTVAGINGNVTTVAGISSNVTTVAGNNTNITTVAGISSDVSTVAGISANVTTVANDGTDIGTVATNISNVNTVAGISSNVTTVAGISSDVTAVAGDATDIGTVATNISNVNAVAGNNTNITTVAGISSNVTTVAGISANVTTVAGDTANIGTIATNLGGTDTIGTVAGSISNVNTVGGAIANVNTVATNISGVNSFAERYRVGSSDPTTSLDEGDLFFNTTSNAYKFYDGSAWQTVNVSGIGSVADDSTPQLGGNLDVNGNEITSASDGNVVLNPNGTGQIQLNSTVVVQDGTHDFDIASHDGSNGLKLGGTLVTSTAAEINVLDGIPGTLTATELGYVDGVTSAIQTQIDAKANIANPTFTTGITSPQVDITAQGDLRLQDSAGGQYVALQAPATISSSYTLTMPTADGSADQVLTTNGSGTLSFADAGGGAWNLVDEVTVSSNTNTVDLEGMNSTYKTYCVVVNEASLSSGENIFMRLKNQGSYDTLVIYSNISHGARSGNNAWYIQQRENLSAFEIMNISSISQAGHSCVMYIHNASSATVRTIIHGTWTAQESGQVYMDVFSGCYSRTTNGETDGIRFFPSNQNWTAGNFRLYGIGG